jgi:hypothetical protein
MATRSAIGVMHGDVCKAVYCHWDGYLENNGAILLEHYDSVKANNLVALGDISSLRSNIGEKHDFGDYKTADEKEWTTFYGRDRGETGTAFKTFHTHQDFINYFDGSGCEYYYLMKDGVWYFQAYNGPLKPLKEELESISAEEAV